MAKKQVSPKELALTAAKAIAAVNPTLNAVVETYPDRIEGLDEKTLGNGPFRGVPFLIKDVFGHEKGRKIEFGSRLCKGMVVEAGTYMLDLLKAAGVNILGRSAAPEYSMSASTESAMFGNTSNPWKKGYSAGGSSGGAQAAVTSGMVPIAHGSDIGGSIRIPASLCGGVRPQAVARARLHRPGRRRGRLRLLHEFHPGQDRARCRRHARLPGASRSPAIPSSSRSPPSPTPRSPAPSRARLRIGMVLNELVGVKVDPEVAKAVEAAGKALAAMGHTVEPASADMGGVRRHSKAMEDLFFFAFDSRLDGYAKRAGTQAGARHAGAGDLVALSARQGHHAGALHGVLVRSQYRAAQARRVLLDLRHLAVANDLAPLRALGQL